MKTQVTRTIASIACAVVAIANTCTFVTQITAMAEDSTIAEETTVVEETTMAEETTSEEYLDNYQELDTGSQFSYITTDGNEQLYNFSLLYEHTEEDLTTFSYLLANPTEVDGIHVRKLDVNGDGDLSIVDYIELWKEVECPSEGFIHEGGHYSYNLVDRYAISWEDIETVSAILAGTLIPKSGAYICKYDYNFSGTTDIYDLVLMKRYYATNPCRFLWYNSAIRIQKEELAELLEAADSFGIENFMIKIGDVVEPYSIIIVDGGFYEERDSYTSHPMQVIPREDTTLDEHFPIEYLKDNMGDEYSLWRWRYDDDNFDEEILWITDSEYGVNFCYHRVPQFYLVPLDENGNRLGCLIE